MGHQVKIELENNFLQAEEPKHQSRVGTPDIY